MRERNDHHMKRLDDIEARTNNAYPGPWARIRTLAGDAVVRTTGGYDIAMTQGYGDCDAFMEPENAEFIAHARQDVPALVAALRAVLALHKPVPGGVGFTDSGYGGISPACDQCGTHDEYAIPYPCPTVTAIHQHLGDHA